MLINVDYTHYSNNLPWGQGQTILAYESSDHGMSWQRSEHRFAEKPISRAATPPTWYGEQFNLKRLRCLVVPASSL